MTVRYVERVTAALRDDRGQRVATLLWGDPAHVLAADGDRVRVRARGREGWLEAADLGDRSLLEVYVIDVGQGDGVLMRTPEGQWHLIDAGVANANQMTRKGAANFLRWKFLTDLGQAKVTLASVIVTHPDWDHYGGLLDVLAGRLADGRTFPVSVATLYHGGLAVFRGDPPLGAVAEGAVAPLPRPEGGVPRQGRFLTELLDDKTSFRTPPRPLQARFARYAALAATVPGRVRRLSHADGHLPGYGPGQGPVTIRVLGPIVERFGAGAGLRWLGSESVTRNGHSVVLRVDYGRARLLLTGDLNAASQRLLLGHHAPEEFAADVAKACHHGSEDVDVGFLRAVAARATVISSGDNESYAHPRPVLMGASARYGREARDADGRVMPPLVYSTELARSVKLGYAESVRVRLEGSRASRTLEPMRARVKVSGARAYRSLARVPVSTDLIYGLVNVRTDGERILCATMREQGSDFDVKVFQAGVDA